MAASRAGSVDAVKLLLAARRRRRTPSNRCEEQTALMWAAAEGHLDVVDALLKAGADPNLQGAPLGAHEAQHAHRLSDRRLHGRDVGRAQRQRGDRAALIKGGADLKLTNGDGATAMMVAIVNDRFDLAAKLLELGADANDGSLYYAVEMHDATTDWRAQGRHAAARRSSKQAHGARSDQAACSSRAPIRTSHSTGQMHSASMCCDTQGQWHAVLPRRRRRRRRRHEADDRAGAKLEWMPPKAVGRRPAATPGRAEARRQDAVDGRDERRQGRRHGRRPRRHPRGRRAAVPRGLEPRAGSTRSRCCSTPARIRTRKRLTATPRCTCAAFAGKLDIVRVLARRTARISSLEGRQRASRRCKSCEKQPARPPPPTIRCARRRRSKQAAQPARKSRRCCASSCTATYQASAAEGRSQ